LPFDATKSMNRRLETASARIRDSEEEVFGELRVDDDGFWHARLAPRPPNCTKPQPQNLI
jgi:hypothetical protein